MWNWDLEWFVHLHWWEFNHLHAAAGFLAMNCGWVRIGKLLHAFSGSGHLPEEARRKRKVFGDQTGSGVISAEGSDQVLFVESLSYEPAMVGPALQLLRPVLSYCHCSHGDAWRESIILLCIKSSEKVTSCLQIPLCCIYLNIHVLMTSKFIPAVWTVSRSTHLHIQLCTCTSIPTGISGLTQPQMNLGDLPYDNSIFLALLSVS